jgi:hypothetical protein
MEIYLVVFISKSTVQKTNDIIAMKLINQSINQSTVPVAALSTNIMAITFNS